MSFVIVSGGMDPVHCGHVRYLKEAAKYGKVIVLLNSDEWLERKKGFFFMSFDERREILQAIECVYAVYEVDDDDETVSEGIRYIHSKLKPFSERFFFAKGGDRTVDNTPEQDVCQELGIEVLFGIGGDKVQSSSELVKNVRQA